MTSNAKSRERMQRRINEVNEKMGLTLKCNPNSAGSFRRRGVIGGNVVGRFNNSLNSKQPQQNKQRQQQRAYASMPMPMTTARRAFSSASSSSEISYEAREAFFMQQIDQRIAEKKAREGRGGGGSSGSSMTLKMGEGHQIAGRTASSNSYEADVKDRALGVRSSAYSSNKDLLIDDREGSTAQNQNECEFTQWF